MILVIPAPGFNGSNLFFSPAIKNNVISGLFIRLIYSTHYFSTNGVNVRDFNRVHLKQIERDILTHYQTDKTKCYALARVPLTCAGKILSISGIWETETSVGLAFKFIRS